MNSCVLTTIAVLFSIVSAQDVRSLCDDPIIHAADRLPNNTYRVYRGDHYWELLGLPDRKGKVEGPFPIWYEHMKPVDRPSSVSTVIGGSADGLTWKFRGQKYWLYRQNGQLIEGGKTGFDSSVIPRGGFNAVLNDGKLGKKGYPVMIGFSAITAYYYNADGRQLRPIGSTSGYKGGKDGENFPPDLTAAFAYPSTDPEVDYYVYLFQRYRYCYRPIKAEEPCKEWHNNTELFGCSGSSSGEPKASQPENPKSGDNEAPAEGGQGDAQRAYVDDGDDSGSSSSGATFLIVIIIVVVVVVAIVIGIVIFAVKAKPPSSQAANKAPAQAVPPKPRAPKFGKGAPAKK